MSSKSKLPQTSGGGGSPDMYNVSAFDFVTSLNLDQLDELRKPIEENIARLLLNKAQIQPQYFEQLNNYHQYILNVLNNMSNIKRVSDSNPYNVNMRAVIAGHTADVINPYGISDKAITDRNGNVHIVPATSFQKEYQAEWLNQFDELVQNGPSWTIPPNNVWTLPPTPQDKNQPMFKESFAIGRIR